MRVTVVLPTYNESQNLVALVERIREVVPDIGILIVDDNSPDGTGTIADGCAARLADVRVIHRPQKQGLGDAYRHAFDEVLMSGVDVVVTMDVDFSHDPEAIPAMLAAVESGADAVVGSRYVPGGSTVNWPVHRRLLSRWGNLYTARILRVPVRDCTSGFRAYRTSVLSAIEPGTTRADGYAFLTELVLRLVRLGYRVGEVPIIFTERVHGKSKMSGRIVAESMLLVTRWGVVGRVRQMTGRSRVQRSR